MKIIKSFLLVGITASFFTTISCTKNNNNPEPEIKDTIEIPVPEVIDLKSCTEQVVNSDNEFGIDLFKRIVLNDTENSNIFISPTSISLCLAMIYNGADGETKTEMETALKKDGLSVAAINKTYKSLMDTLKYSDDKVTLTIANSIFYKQDFDVKQSFIDSNTVNFESEVSALDFNNSNSVNTINNWAAENTNNKITHIIDEIPSDAIMYLINAIYFKGIWKYEFNPENTTNSNFTLQSGSIIQVPTMNRTEQFGYFENNDIQLVQLPYGNGDYNMIIMLPTQSSNITNLTNNLTTSNWNTWISGITTQEVDVRLPKFTFEYESILNDYLSAMGMSSAFNATTADFSKITDAQVYLSKVKHNSFVEVNEEGTEAAAVTTGEVNITSVPLTKYFIANHPFIFAIQEKNTNAIVFIGRVMNPLND